MLVKKNLSHEIVAVYKSVFVCLTGSSLKSLEISLDKNNTLTTKSSDHKISFDQITNNFKILRNGGMLTKYTYKSRESAIKQFFSEIKIHTKCHEESLMKFTDLGRE